MKHDTQTVNGEPYPAPGKWRVNWVEGDVISWRHDPDPDARIHDGATAHVFAAPTGGFGEPKYRVEVNGDRVDTIEPDDYTDRDGVFDRIGDLLIEHGP